MRAPILAAVLLAASATSAVAAGLLELGSPFDEAYRTEFAQCDRHDTFGGKPVSHLHRCSTDPSRFDHLARVPARNGTPGAVIVESKVAHDDDGAAKYCPPNSPRGTSQCQTALLLPRAPGHPCRFGNDPARCVPVDPDSVAYAVIPGASHRHLGLSIGDYGMVILNDKAVPFIVGDSGPENKIGEGSTTLLKQLSPGGKALAVGQGAIFVFFPGTAAPPSSLSPDSLRATVENRASALYQAFRTANP